MSAESTSKGVVGNAVTWFDDRLPLVSGVKHFAYEYPTPRNLNYWWGFGSLAGICLTVQILTGLFLSMHYTAHVDLAFDSVENIMRNVNYGWLMRYMHAVGASMFFIVVYVHIFRGLYYGSYKAPREVLWWLGVLILLLMMGTAFMGYVLPWGQMSFWGATVITNLFSAIPVIGNDIVALLWGGFAVDNPTLNRFFSLHFLLPFVIFGVVAMHVMALHTHGSNNPLGINMKSGKDALPFHPYYTVKDFVGFGVFFLFFAYFIFYLPNYLGHPDNYIEADPLVTPAHIVPEWYFLPFYAILRAVPDKLGGVLAMGGAVLILAALPWLDRSKVRSAAFRPLYRLFFWLFFADCILLGYVGAQTADWGGILLFVAEGSEPVGAWIEVQTSWYKYLPDMSVGRLASIYYFAHFLVILPLLGKYEKPLPLPQSISEPVIRKTA